MLEELDLPARLENPHAMQTKGQMLSHAHGLGWVEFSQLVANTLSCSKLDGGLGYAGGDPNLNCGLCIACLVRRGAFVGAGLTDPTPYLLDRVTAQAREKLISNRHFDIWAVQTWGEREPQIDDLVVAAPWPSGTDYEAMLDVIGRGRTELLGALDAAL